MVALLLAIFAVACGRGGVTDACGHDVSNVRSSVWGIDVATGAIRWTASVPGAEGVVVEDDSHARALARWVDRDTIVAIADGEVVGSVAQRERAGVVLTSGALSWRDQAIAPSIEVDGLTLMTDVWSDPGADRPLHLWAEDASGRKVWSVTLSEDRRSISGVPRPLVMGGIAMVSLIIDPPSTEACVKG